MAKVFIEETTLTAIGDAIRSKTGKTELIDPAVMSTEIESISGDRGLPPEAYVITGDCTNRLSYNGWNWYLDTLGDKLTTKDLTNIQSMFYGSNKLSRVPFELNLVSNYLFYNQSFYSSGFTELPRINFDRPISEQSDIYVNVEMAFYGCSYLRDAENLFAEGQLDALSTKPLTSSWNFTSQCLFSGCSSLRKLPSWYYKLRPSLDSPCLPESWQMPFNFQYCYSLDELVDLPVWRTNTGVSIDSCMFLDGAAFERCNRLKNFTFETQADGTPYVVKWANQYINLRDAGHSFTPVYAPNAGIRGGYDQVSDDATYQEKKDSPDWYASAPAYSRYDHDSAVRTINSLPDTSAYLAEVGGVNTIQFYGISGSNTDGGAINTLTEEEIAVATAKGWTVSLV